MRLSLFSDDPDCLTLAANVQHVAAAMPVAWCHWPLLSL